MSYASHDGQIRYFPPDKNIFFFYMSPYKIWVLTWENTPSAYTLFSDKFIYFRPHIP